MMAVIVRDCREDVNHGLIMAERKHNQTMLLLRQTAVTLKAGVIQSCLAKIGRCIHWKPGVRFRLLDTRLPLREVLFGRVGVKGKKRFACSSLRGMIEVIQVNLSSY